jgi:hypothetical protein
MALEMEDDDEKSGQRTRQLGKLSVDKLVKMPEFKAYDAASKQFALAKAESSKTKTKLKEVLRKKIPILREVELSNLDFTVVNGQINFVEQLQTPRKRRATSELEFEG